MDAANPDLTTGDGNGEVARRVKVYCAQAVKDLKAGRFKEAYLYASEALGVDGKDAKATALYRHARYAVDPKKRLLDKAKTLHEVADRCVNEGDHDKAFELLKQAKKWHCTPGILWARSNLNWGRKRFDLAYLDATEALAGRKEDFWLDRQAFCLRYLGYKVLPVIEPELQRVDEMPTRYPVLDWAKELRIESLYVDLKKGSAEAVTVDGATLYPPIPFDQLARFLDYHVRGSVNYLVFNGSNEEVVLQLLDEVTMPGRLHMLSFADFYFSWASIERIFDGQCLRPEAIRFTRMQLPNGVDPNKLLKLKAVRDCTHLILKLYDESLPQLPGPPPLFDNAALMEWLKRSDGRKLDLTCDYLFSTRSFLDALTKDFLQATEAHSYHVKIDCPGIDVVGLGVRNELLFNRLDETMRIGVGVDPVATKMIGRRPETMFVRRLPPI